MKLGTRTTRTLAAGALLVALALPLTTVPAAEACTSDTCSGGFATLESDVSTYVPPTQATSILTRLNTIDTPGDPCTPTDPCGIAILRGVRSQVVGLGTAGLVSAVGVATITSDINTILPGNPG
jgi:hypothetical protein